MEMPAFNWIALPHVTILVPDVIATTAVIEAAVAVIIAHTIPEEAIPMANATEATSGGGPIPMTHHDHDHPDDATTDHDLA